MLEEVFLHIGLGPFYIAILLSSRFSDFLTSYVMSMFVFGMPVNCISKTNKLACTSKNKNI